MMTGTSTCSSNTQRQIRKTCSFAFPCTIAGQRKLRSICFRRSGFETRGSRETRRSPRCVGIEGDRVLASHAELGERTLQCDGNPELLFTENETNAKRLWGGSNSSTYVKDAFHEYVIAGAKEAVNPETSRDESCRALSTGSSGRWEVEWCA